jgi:hypothetical protein
MTALRPVRTAAASEPEALVAVPGGAPRHLRRVEAAALAVHLASLAAGLAVLLHVSRSQWFFGDEWDFLSLRRRGTTVGIWAPHNEHWVTIPLLVFRALYDAVGLRTYRPYLLVLLALHLLLVHLLWQALRRSGAGVWLATALAAMFVLLGAGWEDLLQAFQIGFVGAVTFGVAALLLLDHDGRFGWRDVAAWALAVAALMCSAVGVTMVVVAGIAALLRRGWRAAALAVSVPAAVYAAWFLAAGRHSADTIPPTRTELLTVPTYVWTGLTRTVEAVTGWPGAGPVVVLGLVAALLRVRGTARGRGAVAVATALGAVVFLTVTGVGRIALGVEQAASSRYAYVVCALLLGAVALAVSELGRGSAAVTAVAVVAAGAATVQGVGLLSTGARMRLAVIQPSRDQILASVRLLESGAPLVAGPDALPEPRYSPNMTLAGLRQLVDEGAFGRVGDPPEAARLAAALQLQVAVTDTPAADPGLAPRLSAPAGTVTRRGACVVLHSAGQGTVVRLTDEGPVSVGITPSADGPLTVRLASASDPGVVSAPNAVPLRAGRTVHLRVSASGAEAVVSLPAGDDLVCGAQM